MSSTLEVLDKICQKSILGLWPWSNCCFVNFLKSLLKEKETLKKSWYHKAAPYSLTSKPLFTSFLVLPLNLSWNLVWFLSACYCSCCFTFPVREHLKSWGHCHTLPWYQHHGRKKKRNPNPNSFSQSYTRKHLSISLASYSFQAKLFERCLNRLSALSSPFALVHFIYDQQICS